MLYFRLLAFVFIISFSGKAISADLFTIDGIKVNSTSTNAKQAKDNAMAAGQKEAFSKLLERITTSQPNNLANIDAAKISELVQGIEVNNEKITSTFYSATLSISFNRALVDNLLKDSNVSFTDKKSLPIVILPLFLDGQSNLLFEAENPLRSSLSATASANHVLNISIPSKGAVDKSSLTQNIENIDSSTKESILKMGQDYNADKLILIVAYKDADKLIIRMQDLKDPAGAIKEMSFKNSDLQVGEDIFGKAARNIISLFESQWIKDKADSNATSTKITLTVPFSSLEEWIAIRNRIENLSFLKSSAVTSLTAKYALIQISFSDDFESLTTKMNEQGLVLENTGTAIILRAK